MKLQPENSTPPIHFDNSYARLPERFYTRQEPVSVSKPELIRVNYGLASELGIDPKWLKSEDGIEVIAGNKVPVGSDPIATVYAGHQFGRWSPQLGDGRAILLGEVITPTKERFDFQLKGSGPTPYSRGSDGRAPLGPILREYIVSEAMHAFGIPTTRTLAAAKTGDSVYRDDTLLGAILVRIAQSHIRIGTFEFFSFKQDLEALRILTDHVIDRHYPEAKKHDNSAYFMLKAVIKKQADLIASWKAVGFIHGVMNTDNMLLSGETIDYGPCAFMDHFDPWAVYSFIDRQGRYAYGNQPAIGQWNLAQLAQVLFPLLHEDRETARNLAQQAIDTYPSLYEQAYQKKMRAKIGLQTHHKGDEKLLEDLLTIMAENKMDFTLTFRHLSDLVEPDQENHVGELIEFPDAMKQWLEQWEGRLGQEETSPDERQKDMYSTNPAFIPRNHLIEDVIERAVNHDDLSAFHTLVETLDQPYTYNPKREKYALPPRVDQIVPNTFCGT